MFYSTQNLKRLEEFTQVKLAEYNDVHIFLPFHNSSLREYLGIAVFIGNYNFNNLLAKRIHYSILHYLLFRKFKIQNHK